MEIFAFVVLTLILFATLLLVGYLHMKREFDRKWKRYARRAFQQVKSLESLIQSQLDETNAILKDVSIVRKDNPVLNFGSYDPRSKMEDRIESEMADVVVVNNRPVKVGR